MKSCEAFDLTPEPVECCHLCHTGQGDHSMVGVKDYKQEVMAHVCHPLAERLRALGYLFEGEVKTDDRKLAETG